MKAPRIHAEQGFVLQLYAWSETSAIAQIFTRHHGRVAVAAKGVKRPGSHLRALLLPLQPLLFSWSGSSEVKNLTAVDWTASADQRLPSGADLLIGTYFNELCLRLLPHEQSEAALFDIYEQCLMLQLKSPASARLLSPLPLPLPPQLQKGTNKGANKETNKERSASSNSIARVFELLILQSLGWMPDLLQETWTNQPVHPEKNYYLDADAGLILSPNSNLRGDSQHGGAAAAGLSSITGAVCLALAAPLLAHDVAAVFAVLQCNPSAVRSLRPMLAKILLRHSGSLKLQTPHLMPRAQEIARAARPVGLTLPSTVELARSEMR